MTKEVRVYVRHATGAKIFDGHGSYESDSSELEFRVHRSVIASFTSGLVINGHRRFPVDGVRIQRIDKLSIDLDQASSGYDPFYNIDEIHLVVETV